MGIVFRPPQHETDDKGEALLHTIFAQLGWTVNRIGKDYGRDFEIEIFRDGKSTGIVFNVQLKSSEAPSYSKRGEFVSVDLKVANARYLAEELHLPTFVIQADVSQNKLFWSAPQIDSALGAHLANSPHAKSCTIRVPVKNEFPATVQELVETVGQLATVLASKRLMGIDPDDLLFRVPALLHRQLPQFNLRENSSSNW